MNDLINRALPHINYNFSGFRIVFFFMKNRLIQIHVTYQLLKLLKKAFNRVKNDFKSNNLKIRYSCLFVIFSNK